MTERLSLRERAFQFGLAVMLSCPRIRSRGAEWVPVADQLARAATAVGAMLEEGVAAASRREPLRQEAHELAAMLTVSVRKLRTPRP